MRILLVPLMFLLSSCSLEASIYSLLPPEVFEPAAKVTGLVPGSSQSGVATGGYIIQSTVGNYTSQTNQKTDDGEYKVYSSVQETLLNR